MRQELIDLLLLFHEKLLSGSSLHGIDLAEALFELCLCFLPESLHVAVVFCFGDFLLQLVALSVENLHLVVSLGVGDRGVSVS